MLRMKRKFHFYFYIYIYILLLQSVDFILLNYYKLFL
jgi:hypothetical protein